MKGLEIAPVDELIFVDSPGRGKRRLGQCEEILLSFHNSVLDMALHAGKDLDSDDGFPSLSVILENSSTADLTPLSALDESTVGHQTTEDGADMMDLLAILQSPNKAIRPTSFDATANPTLSSLLHCEASKDRPASFDTTADSAPCSLLQLEILKEALPPPAIIHDDDDESDTASRQIPLNSPLSDITASSLCSANIGPRVTFMDSPFLSCAGSAWSVAEDEAGGFNSVNPQSAPSPKVSKANQRKLMRRFRKSCSLVLSTMLPTSVYQRKGQQQTLMSGSGSGRGI
jgi:hypothetical protein